MTWGLLLALTAITIASRVLPMALLPVPTGRAATLLEALPAPLFASLAALALFDNGSGLPPPPLLLAALGALLGSTRRSLATTLVAGVAGFLLGDGLW